MTPPEKHGPCEEHFEIKVMLREGRDLFARIEQQIAVLLESIQGRPNSAELGLKGAVADISRRIDALERAQATQQTRTWDVVRVVVQVAVGATLGGWLGAMIGGGK